MILTDEERRAICLTSTDSQNASHLETILKAYEQAILAKLAEGQHPVMWVTGMSHSGVPQQAGMIKTNMPLYLHPSAELTALRAEVERLRQDNVAFARNLKGNAATTGATYEHLCNQIAAEQAAHAATQAREQRLRDYLESITWAEPITWAHELAKDALVTPADRSALDAYLAPYKLDAERYRHLRELPKEQAQAYFWNYTSRKQRDKAIDAAIAAAKEKKGGSA